MTSEHVRRYAVLVSCVLLLPAVGCQRGPSTAHGSFTNSVGMTMVKLSSGYYVSKYETRQAEFEAVMGYNPSYYPGANHPVESITGDQAEEFCLRLTELERQKGLLPEGCVYDLPTYEQWMQFVEDASLNDAIVPRQGKTFETHQQVGDGDINRLGLYDIRGNVAEYSKDTYNTGSKIVLGAWVERAP